MSATKTSVTVAAFFVAALAYGGSATPAQAQYYYAAPPVYVAPPAYYAPPPVYYAPPPVYYYPRPYYYGGGGYYRPYYGGRSFGFGFNYRRYR